MVKRTDLLLILCIALAVPAHGQTSTDPRPAISKLMEDFQHATVSGDPRVENFFSPAVRVHDAKQIDALQATPFLKFVFADYNVQKGLQVLDDAHARLDVRVDWETRHQQVSQTTTLSFEEVNGQWYFSDPEFWQMSFVWAFPLIALGIAYGCGFTIMYWHSNKQLWVNPRKKVFWQAAAVVPFSIFFYFARRPWAT